MAEWRSGSKVLIRTTWGGGGRFQVGNLEVVGKKCKKIGSEGSGCVEPTQNRAQWLVLLNTIINLRIS
jgi:hypothetical protein